MVLRLAAGLPVVAGNESILWGALGAASFPAYVAGIAVGSLVLGGLWTPVSCAALAILELAAIVAGESVSGVHMARGAVAVSLAMLGPGAWSVDARLFGRRRIVMNGPGGT